jgi:hypothetical protein
MLNPLTNNSYTLQVRKNKFIEILPINVGCLGACTYCKTKHARGHLGSYTIDSLVSVLLLSLTEMLLLLEFLKQIICFQFTIGRSCENCCLGRCSGDMVKQ